MQELKRMKEFLNSALFPRKQSIKDNGFENETYLNWHLDSATY